MKITKKSTNTLYREINVISNKFIDKNLSQTRYTNFLFKFFILIKNNIVHFMFRTFAISTPLKSGFNSCLVVLEPLKHNTADLNKLKDCFALSQAITMLISPSTPSWIASGLV